MRGLRLGPQRDERPDGVEAPVAQHFGEEDRPVAEDEEVDHLGAPAATLARFPRPQHEGVSADHTPTALLHDGEPSFRPHARRRGQPQGYVDARRRKFQGVELTSALTVLQQVKAPGVEHPGLGPRLRTECFEHRSGRLAHYEAADSWLPADHSLGKHEAYRPAAE